MIITKNNIKWIEQNMAGKWRVWVAISPEECQIFKFLAKPTLAEVQLAVDKLPKPLTKEEKIAEINKQIIILEEMKIGITDS